MKGREEEHLAIERKEEESIVVAPPEMKAKDITVASPRTPRPPPPSTPDGGIV
jgi:hypothetical protein